MTEYFRHGDPDENNRQKISLDSSRQSDLAYLEFIKRNSPKLQQSDTIIDLGCGAGYFTAKLQNYFHCKVLGVDADLKLINHAKQMHKRKNIQFMHSSFFENHDKLKSLDAKLVSMRQVLLDVPDRPKLISWAKSILPNRGRVFALEPDYTAAILHPKIKNWDTFYKQYKSLAQSNTEDWETGRKLLQFFLEGKLDVIDFIPIIEVHSNYNKKLPTLIESELFNYKMDLKKFGLLKKYKNLFDNFSKIKTYNYAFVQTQMYAICGK